LQLPTPGVLLIALLLISLVLIALIVFRPAITNSREGKILAFLAFLILPVLCMTWEPRNISIAPSKRSSA
jgi:uncharacterized membrane protein YqjE